MKRLRVGLRLPRLRAFASISSIAIAGCAGKPSASDGVGESSRNDSSHQVENEGGPDPSANEAGTSGGATGTLTGPGGAAAGGSGGAGVVEGGSDRPETGPPIDGNVPRGAGVPCAGRHCAAGTEFCAANPYGETFASCFPSGEHPCAGGCLIAECDGPEDCAEGEVCEHQFGESDYFRCAAAPGERRVCATAADCTTDLPYCVSLRPDSDDLHELLGWRPGVCSGQAE